MTLKSSPWILLPLTLLLSACIGPPVFDTKDLQLESALTPIDVSKTSDSAAGKHVLWGGLILKTSNLTNVTQLEVLAYPLNERHAPKLNDSPQGRFIILQPGYLEPLSYAQGRRVSVLGRLGENRDGRVGDSQYQYPVVEAEKLHLWREGGESRTTFHLGIGIQL